MSAVTRSAGRLIVRCVRLAAEPGEVTIHLGDAAARGERVDLLGRPLDGFEGRATLVPFEIMTVALQEKLPGS